MEEFEISIKCDRFPDFTVGDLWAIERARIVKWLRNKDQMARFCIDHVEAEQAAIHIEHCRHLA